MVNLKFPINKLARRASQFLFRYLIASVDLQAIFVHKQCTCLIPCFQNGQPSGVGFYSELDQDVPPETVTTSLFPSPTRTDDSDTNWSERASSRSSSTPVVNDHPPSLNFMRIKREKLHETEVGVALLYDVVWKDASANIFSKMLLLLVFFFWFFSFSF